MAKISHPPTATLLENHMAIFIYNHPRPLVSNAVLSLKEGLLWFTNISFTHMKPYQRIIIIVNPVFPLTFSFQEQLKRLWSDLHAINEQTSNLESGPTE